MIIKKEIPMNVLIVEDEPIQLNGIVEIIKSGFNGVKCFTALNYKEATDLLSSNIDIDVILLDIELNDTDNLTGIDLGRYIRTFPQFENTPILFITGYSAEAADAIHATNCFDFLVKPYDASDLTTSIQKLIDKHIITENPIRFRNSVGVCFNVRPSEIIYMNCIGRNIYVYTLSGRFVVHSSLKDVLKTLPDDFIRCHRSYIVNQHFIANYDKTTKYVAVKTPNKPTSIPIGQAYYKSFVSQLKD